MGPSREAASNRGDVMVRIAEQVGVVEGSLALQPLGIDGEPASLLKIENVAMVNIAMKRDNFMRIGKQHLCGFGATDEYAAFSGGDVIERPEPMSKGDKLRRRRTTRGMQSCNNVADDEARLVIHAVRRHVGEGATACRAFK